MEKIEKFFVVSQTSAYKVQQPDAEENPVVKKIGILGESDIAVGQIFKPCRFVGITPDSGLVVYNYSKRLSIEKISTSYWDPHTSPISALFLNDQPAFKCLMEKDRQDWDEQWLSETREVMKAIGDFHPTFIISKWSPPGYEIEAQKRFLKTL